MQTQINFIILPTNYQGVLNNLSPTTSSPQQLAETARRLRISIIEMLSQAGSGHSGGSLSCIDILTCLFFSYLDHDATNPHHEERDRFILSKGHGAPALYAVLAECGYFPNEWLSRLRRMGAELQGHPDMRRVPGVEISTGSLGQGLSLGVGMALADRLDSKQRKVVVLMGDGEQQEGMVWEAAMAAAHHGLDNLIGIVDLNGLQIDGQVCQVMNIAPLADKWAGFGWQVKEVDGHNLEELLSALAWCDEQKGKPQILIARTVKGKGVSFMENKKEYHGVAPSPQERIEALSGLGCDCGVKSK